jgi:hypothetical protein
MITTPVRRLLVAAVVVGCALAPAASARSPEGDWTYVRKDAFRHYACKQKGEGGHWKVKTATFWNRDQMAIDEGIGAYTAIARGSDERLVSSRTSTAWKDGYVRTTLRGAEASDRLWMQGSYYGPAEPWSDGISVRRLVRCGAAD